ncbi:uncharacterized protein si:dkey-9i23.16 isoform X2 [Puntigrus tetrazona]|uniref:uncharacterized protein si:dkey-9i23.16 isoform X2 n=1 Tax=Puntigrus tetrazona TaxID=1606681 RepID=UPI001C8B032F|nr:uncharacterized protein si:dkey-9i23.16 isoform X2 [Puntigrus tetrazona]
MLMAILLGLIQLLLTAPTYNISLDINFLYICPLCVGSVSVIAGSFGMASERTPKRDLLKYCLICGLAGLVGTLIGLVLYSYAASTSLNIPSCSSEYSENSTCPDIIFQSLYKAISGQLVFYNIATLVIHCFLLFSAFKGLRKH